MSHPQAHFETRSTSGGFLGEIVTFVVVVVEAARDWVASLWLPTAPTSETTQVKEGSKQASVAPPQSGDSSTTLNVFSGSVEEQNPLSDTGNTEDPSVLPPFDSTSPPTRDLDDTHAIEAEESKNEVPLVQDPDLEPTADIHEIALANSSSQEWVSVPKPDAESLSSIKASDAQPEAATDSRDSHDQETTLESTLKDAPTIPYEVTTTNSSDTSSPLLPTPEPDTQSFDNAEVRVPTDAEVPLNPESNVEVGPVSELKARKSNPSLSDSSSINRASAELPTKKKRGGSFIRKQTTLMTKVFKGKDGSTNLTSPSKGSLTIDNQSITSSLVAEPDSMVQSTPAPDSADTPKFTSPSRVSIGSISSMSGSIKKKFRKNSIAAVSTPDQESRSDVSEVSSSNLPSKVAEPSLLKSMFKVRKPLN